MRHDFLSCSCKLDMIGMRISRLYLNCGAPLLLFGMSCVLFVKLLLLFNNNYLTTLLLLLFLHFFLFGDLDLYTYVIVPFKSSMTSRRVCCIQFSMWQTEFDVIAHVSFSSIYLPRLRFDHVAIKEGIHVLFIDRQWIIKQLIKQFLYLSFN